MELKKQAVVAPSTILPNVPVTFTDACVGCNTCVNVCRTDVLLPNPQKGGIQSWLFRTIAGTAAAA